MSKNSKDLCWLLKVVFNNKKIPIIPPLFHEKKFATDLKK